MRKTITMACALALCTFLVVPALAQNTMLDFTGFVYESDNTPGVQGFPPSEVGDVLTLVGFIENIGPELLADPDWDPNLYQLTIHLSGLTSTGEYDTGTGMVYIVYNDGVCDIVADPHVGGTPPDYGTDPPSAVAPGTFVDGDVYLHGEFTTFYMTYHPSLHVGSFEGYVVWTGGSQLSSLFQDPVGYTVAGTVDPFSAPVPDGYDLEADGHISFDAAIRGEDRTWGQLKSLYR